MPLNSRDDLQENPASDFIRNIWTQIHYRML